jgi:hypothetical protein
MTEIPINYKVHWNRDVPMTVDVYTYKIDIHEQENSKTTTIKNPHKIFLGSGVYLWKKTVVPEVTTLLINTKDLEYVYTNQVLEKFTALSKIEKFVSNIGNNDIPYTFAIDTEGRYYLLLENVILLNYNQECDGDPYDYYYSECQMSALKSGGMNIFKEDPFNDIYSLIIDDEDYECDQYSMTYSPNPRNSNNLYLKYHDNLSIPVKITAEEYKELNYTFGLLRGFQCMNISKL